MPIFHEAFLPLIHLDSPADWDLLFGACRGFLTTRDYGRLRGYLATSAKAVLVEVDYIDKDYRDTYSNFYAKKFANYPSRAVRLHFFRKSIPPLAVRRH